MNVAKSDPVAMVLKTNVSAFEGAVLRPFGKFAVRHTALPVLATQGIADNLLMVQPMGDLVADHFESCMIPFASSINNATRCRV